MTARPYNLQKKKSPILPAIVAAILIIAGIFLVALVVRTNMDKSQTPPAAQTSPQDNPLHGIQLYVDPNSNAARQAVQWRQSDPDKAATMDKLAAQPTALWATYPGSIDGARQYVAAAGQENKVPVIVSYYFPKRDCGRYSTGGAADGDAYKAFIGSLAGAIGNTRTIVILEPDALPNLKAFDDQGQPCLSADEQQMYFSLMDHAVTTLKAQSGVSLYIDAGNSAWITDTTEIANRLERASIKKADGFSLNVSNFQATGTTVAYGDDIAAKLGGAHYVIDTSRNGKGPYTNPDFPAHGWCNPPERALGHYPTTNTGKPQLDAYLFIKRPGESDGADNDPKKCFNGPKAGDWWPDYAVGLTERWPKELQPN